jgi:predicted NodU family carbamoyl transferase
MLRHVRQIFPRAKVSLRHFDHEYCHARSTYDFGPIDEALVLTMDGRETTACFRAPMSEVGIFDSCGGQLFAGSSVRAPPR